MALESKPLFHPEVIRQQVKSFTLPERVQDWHDKLQHWAGLITSGRAEDFKETALLPRSTISSTPTNASRPSGWHLTPRCSNSLSSSWEPTALSRRSAIAISTSCSAPPNPSSANLCEEADV